MEIEKFKDLLKSPESTYLDWKRDFPEGLIKGSKDPNWEIGKGILLKDIVSLANSLIEGNAYLIYGVQDNRVNRQIIGISKSFDDATFQSWARNVFDPPVIFLYSELLYNSNNIIGIFEIETSPDFPHVVKQTIGDIIFEGQVWFRNGSKNSVALYDDLKRMFQGVEPFKLERTGEPIVDETVKYYNTQGYGTCWCRISDKDNRLSQGYKIAYLPRTRREIWIVPYNNPPDVILMLKPKH